MRKWKYGVGPVKERPQATSCDGLLSDISVLSFFMRPLAASQAHNHNIDGAQRERTKIQLGKSFERPLARPRDLLRVGPTCP
jgi:hypothetical protein